jgi:uncharacterized protein
MTLATGTERSHIARLAQFLRRGFALDWGGIHGAPHWARVRLNGLRLARHTGASAAVVEYFALLHDCRRQNDGRDPEHGRRGADLAFSLRGSLVLLSDADFDRLHYACVHHSRGLLEADVTVQTCWDADRLDLGRVGIRPNPARLCTPAARSGDILERAYLASVRG